MQAKIARVAQRLTLTAWVHHRLTSCNYHEVFSEGLARIAAIRGVNLPDLDAVGQADVFEAVS